MTQTTTSERPSDPTSRPSPQISVVVPMYNEAENLSPLIARLVPVLERCAASFEVVFVDDGSRDNTLDVLRAAHAVDPRLGGISFSRNFGKEVAIAAGLDHARGDAVVIMDADLQHPPEVIETFVERWHAGFQNVYAQRTDREGDSPLRRWLTEKFYEMFAIFGETRLPPGAGDFRLLDRKAVSALRAMPERARFSKGLYAWIGFRSTGVPFTVADRAHGESKFSYRKLTRFALDGLMSFTTLPLRIWTFIGTLVSTIALLLAAYFLLKTAAYGVDVPGYASLIVSILFFAGIQLMSLGILGEYVGRIFAEVKRRPLYLIAERIGASAVEPSSEVADSPLPVRVVDRSFQ
ncbi:MULTISPECIES: glycosyltransferase family 2 protein [unclassified Beijerinckia]|uniref:glycosyltransferase family 2 protein n=1 Tax=unclassified Beijerinckia TaxID=2638183 RepID=UPI00089C32E1|nr:MULTISPECIES: glycosyltransferase family 2 protein [unclassified Beijerinckia]MDH7796481.1 glycosyltransferase involved in cell wall biosynthesis [Beijerinckia sp. GAS462]SEC46980.1 Glycosyltransferase involved in cell wall bisynthesis [Beijerinckia sp. 28-YEA-48]